MARNIKWILLFCFICFFALVEYAFNKEIMKCDILGHEIIQLMMSDNLTGAMEVITWFGSAFCLIIITLIFLIINREIGALMGLNLIVVTALNQFLKFVFKRPRPSYMLIAENGFSFPSGHSMVSLAFYGFLIYLVYKNISNKILKRILIILLGALIVLIGFSRIYLGVHYVSDVMAGFIISFGYLVLFIDLFNNRGFLKIRQR